MKTSNKLLVGALVLLISGIVVGNIMLKKQINEVKMHPETETTTDSVQLNIHIN